MAYLSLAPFANKSITASLHGSLALLDANSAAVSGHHIGHNTTLLLSRVHKISLLHSGVMHGKLEAFAEKDTEILLEAARVACLFVSVFSQVNCSKFSFRWTERVPRVGRCAGAGHRQWASFLQDMTGDAVSLRSKCQNPFDDMNFSDRFEAHNISTPLHAERNRNRNNKGLLCWSGRG